MDDKEYAKIIDKIMAMDLLVRSFNDEEWVGPWLTYGVPDGCECREDYEVLYPNDEDLEETYADLSARFCRLIARQVAKIETGSGGHRAMLVFNGNGVII